MFLDFGEGKSISSVISLQETTLEISTGEQHVENAVLSLITVSVLYQLLSCAFAKSFSSMPCNTGHLVIREL